MTTDIKELVKRLREVFVEDRGHGHTTEWTRNLDGHEAADALEALAGEVERLKETITTAVQFNEGLAAERDRLKAAITEALNNAQDRLDYDCKCKDCTDTLAPVEDVLRKALGGDAS